MFALIVTAPIVHVPVSIIPECGAYYAVLNTSFTWKDDRGREQNLKKKTIQILGI